MRVIPIATDIFRSVDEAEAFLNKHDVNLIIHGIIQKGKEEKVTKYDLSNLFFSFKYHTWPNNSTVKGTIQKDAQLFLSSKTWVLSEENDLPDMKRLSAELSTAILSMIGIGLSESTNECHVSIAILENLLPSLESKMNASEIQPQLDPLTKKITISGALVKTGRLRAILSVAYKTRMILCFLKNEHAEVCKLVSKYERQVPITDISVLSSAAISAYLTGNESDARRYTDLMHNIVPISAVYFLNKAFFLLKDGKYDEALGQYKNLINRIDNNNISLITQTIGFLDDERAKTPKNFGYLFAIGYLMYHLIDRQKGKSDLSNFCKLAKTEAKYRAMVSAAKLCK